MNFVEALSTTDDMTYFKAAYVQRLLLHIWEDTTKYQYWFTFSLALISQLLI